MPRPHTTTAPRWHHPSSTATHKRCGYPNRAYQHQTVWMLPWQEPAADAAEADADFEPPPVAPHGNQAFHTWMIRFLTLLAIVGLLHAIIPSAVTMLRHVHRHPTHSYPPPPPHHTHGDAGALNARLRSAPPPQTHTCPYSPPTHRRALKWAAWQIELDSLYSRSADVVTRKHVFKVYRPHPQAE